MLPVHARFHKTDHLFEAYKRPLEWHQESIFPSCQCQAEISASSHTVRAITEIRFTKLSGSRKGEWIFRPSFRLNVLRNIKLSFFKIFTF